MDREFFNDEDFQDCLIHTLLHDLPALRQLAPLLHENDFKPVDGIRNGPARWLLAGRILEYFHKNHDVLGNLARSEVLAYCAQNRLGARKKSELLGYIAHLRKLVPKGIQVTIDRVTEYKRERLKADAVGELVDLLETEQLTDEKMYDICMAACNTNFSGGLASDYYAGVEDRIARRSHHAHRDPAPLFNIDPLDAIVRGVGPGGLGLALAPYKRGKTLFLLHLACAFSLQRISTAYFTLEDPLQEIENNLDSRITAIRAIELASKPRLFRKRFLRYKRLIRKHLWLFDGTEDRLSVARIEEICLRERDRGHPIGAVLIDYDDEIATANKKERRFEFADIYRDLRRMAARNNQIVWTAAQTKRGTESKRVLKGDDIAEDISKIRKATMTLSLGQGQWGPESVYLHVVAHKFDRGGIGCNIIGDRSRKLFYDPVTTARKQREEGEDVNDDDI